MTEPEAFVVADQTLNHVVEQISADQWALKLPDWFQTSKSEADITLRELINYHAYDDAWVPDMLAGHTMQEVGEDKWKDQDLLGADPKASFAAIVDKAVAAARDLRDLNRTVHTSFGDFTAQEYLWQANSFRGLRANQIARVIGVDDTLPPNLVQALWDELVPHAEEWRQIGIFQAEIPVSEDAPLQQRLLGKLGLEPLAPTTRSVQHKR
jgi:hypothetical protein